MVRGGLDHVHCTHVWNFQRIKIRKINKLHDSKGGSYCWAAMLNWLVTVNRTKGSHSYFQCRLELALKCWSIAHTEGGAVTLLLGKS